MCARCRHSRRRPSRGRTPASSASAFSCNFSRPGCRTEGQGAPRWPRRPCLHSLTSEYGTMQQDEIYLVDLWRIFVREWKWFVLVLVLTLACTYAFAHLAKRQWEATAWIQIAQVGQVPAGQDPKVEPLQRVTEVLQSAGYAPTSSVAGLYRKSLKLEPMLYAGSLVKLTVRAYSRQQASELAAATVAQLRLVHQGLEEAPLAAARARLAQIDAELQTA